ncbi:hypothetical protein BJ878DRAFT_205942 [Calycina marina]|uniref:Uncharacterized protein n=1 Tax=Calycina marina TaxID=1763456 RepID=A0A9P7YYQ8_9HELO|nr:hypothetical protein BJ878DRAFT_205942 [Calycina marina]
MAHAVNEVILAALKLNSDPVDALIALHPEESVTLAQPRLLHVFGEESVTWLTEGDKFRLHRNGKKIMDITDHDTFNSKTIISSAGKACRLTRQEAMFLLSLE